MADAGPTPNAFELPDTVEAIEYYYEQGLTDGLPVVPPTEQRVIQFLEQGGVEPDEVLGTRPSRNWVVTADKVAINAIMAGCLPEYAPVVLAAVRAMMKPAFNASAITETTGGMSTPMVLVNGPISRELDINSGWNLFGPGWRANSTIGRSLRLVLINVCNEVPGIRDKSAFGSPARYTCCIAEAEETSPWEPWHVEKGYPLDSNAVTLFAAFPPMSVSNYVDNTPEGILDTISQNIAANNTCHGEVILIMSGEHLATIGPAGWSKRRVKEYIANKVDELKPVLYLDQGRGYEMGGSTPQPSKPPARPTSPDDIDLLVGGGPGGGVSALLPLFGIGDTVMEPIVEP